MTILQNEARPEIHEHGQRSCTLDCRRSCRCCGSSLSFNDRKEADEYQSGLDVCPSCILHFRTKNCLES